MRTIQNIEVLTDAQGRLIPGIDTAEPEPGSIVLTEGEWGTAWQRFFSDDRWHPVRGGGSKTWAEMLNRRNLVLVYDANPRYENSPERVS